MQAQTATTLNSILSKYFAYGATEMGEKKGKVWAKLFVFFFSARLNLLSTFILKFNKSGCCFLQ